MELRKEALVMAQTRVSNMDDETRRYDVAGEVTVRDGRFESVYSGTVDSPDGERVAEFSTGAGQPTNIHYYKTDITDSGQVEVLTEIQAFVAACREYAEEP
ncbi:MAG: hypothetical protein K2J49_03845 [Muribaculaceae bacterium]|nr:hypothetical protein [Muribaculaceae bacterium]